MEILCYILGAIAVFAVLGFGWRSRQLKDFKEQLKHKKTIESEIEELEYRRKDLTFEITNLSQDKIDKWQEYMDTVVEIQEAEERKSAISQELADLNLQCDAQRTMLAQLLESVLATRSRKEGFSTNRCLDYTKNDAEVYQLLLDIVDKIPTLRTAIAKVSWTAIWQPKFQQMTDDLLRADKCGIYRIYTINDDGTEISYIGQAKHIRDRWSQHIKKMLGVDTPDNHKFYSRVSPLNAHFDIVEECPEQSLNEREHYWIAFYNCVAEGYNTKV